MVSLFYILGTPCILRVVTEYFPWCGETWHWGGAGGPRGDMINLHGGWVLARVDNDHVKAGV